MLLIRTNFMYSMFSLKLECNITTTPFLYEEASVNVTYNVLIADKHVWNLTLLSLHTKMYINKVIVNYMYTSK